MPKSFQQQHVLFHFLVSFLRCQIRALASLGKEQPGSERGQRGMPPPSTSRWWVRKVTHFFLRLELKKCRVKLSQRNPSVPLEGEEMGMYLFKSKNSNNVHRHKLKELPWQFENSTGSHIRFPDYFIQIHLSYLCPFLLTLENICRPFSVVGKERMAFQVFCAFPHDFWTLAVSLPEQQFCDWWRVSCLWARTIALCLRVTSALLPHHFHFSISGVSVALFALGHL